MPSNKQRTAQGRNSLKWILSGNYKGLISARTNKYILPEESEGIRLAICALETILEVWDGRTEYVIRITTNKEK